MLKEQQQSITHWRGWGGRWWGWGWRWAGRWRAGRRRGRGAHGHRELVAAHAPHLIGGDDVAVQPGQRGQAAQRARLRAASSSDASNVCAFIQSRAFCTCNRGEAHYKVGHAVLGAAATLLLALTTALPCAGLHPSTPHQKARSALCRSPQGCQAGWPP
jgi:hypothetical protein